MRNQIVLSNLKIKWLDFIQFASINLQYVFNWILWLNFQTWKQDVFFFLRLSMPLMLIEKFIKHVLLKCQRFVTLVSHIFKSFGFGFILTVCVIHAINTNNSFSMFYTVFLTMDQLHWSVAPIRHLPMFLSHSCHFNVYDFENRFVYITLIKELLEINCFSAETKLSLSD